MLHQSHSKVVMLGAAMCMSLALGQTGPARAQDNDEAPHPKRKIAVLEYRAGSSVLPRVDERVAGILRKKTSLTVIDGDDARRRYGGHLDRKIVGCAGDTACIAGIGQALGASEVVLVGISQFGDVILTLQRIDVGKRRVLMRVAEALSQGAEPDDDDLLRYLQRVLPRSDFLRFGMIRIHANVKGATVVIGDRERGRTPVEPVRVKAPATYDIRLTKPGYVPFRASVAVPPDAEVQVEPVLSLEVDNAWYKRWWVLALAGTVTAGAVTTVILTRDTSSDVPVTIEPF